MPFLHKKGFSLLFDSPSRANWTSPWLLPPTEEFLSVNDATNSSSAKKWSKEGTPTLNDAESGRTVQSGAEGLIDAAWRRDVKPEAKSKGKEVSDEKRKEGDCPRVVINCKMLN